MLKNLPRAGIRWTRTHTIALGAVVFVLMLYFSHRQYDLPRHVYDRITHVFPTESYMPPNLHPIDVLFRNAKTSALSGSAQDAFDVKKAALRYRKARGRHPPPGFDKWFAFAKARGAPVPEAWFDPIYSDLEPFWGVPAGDLRSMVASWHNVISVRDGKLSSRSNSSADDVTISAWMTVLQQLESDLPDVDLAFNDLQEPRIIVPWEDMERILQSAAKTRHYSTAPWGRTVVDKFSSYPPLSSNSDSSIWEEPADYWLAARKACPPESEARNLTKERELFLPPSFPNEPFAGSYHGYVSDWTLARSSCANPHLRSLHGALLAPLHGSMTTKLFPMLSSSKMTGINNDILVPNAEALADAVKSHFDGHLKDTPWQKKLPVAYWRGVASGGAHNANNWGRFHRHRLVSMLNASQVTAAEALAYAWDPPLSPELKQLFLDSTVQNFPLPNNSVYPLSALQTTPTTLGAWTARLADAAFTHLQCATAWTSAASDNGAACFYSDKYYRTANRSSIAEVLAHAYLPAVDGRGPSPRWLVYLQSNSLPLKSSLFSEWHDARVVPWAHFVPLAPDLRDWWGVLEYFAGYDPAVKTYAPGEIVDDTLRANATARGTSIATASAGQSTSSSKHQPRNAASATTTAPPQPSSKETAQPQANSTDPAHPPPQRMTRTQLEALRKAPHDGVAQQIALRGAELAARALRAEDMVVYMYRVILEYARVVDEGREEMGWVGDLW